MTNEFKISEDCIQYHLYLDELPLSGTSIKNNESISILEKKRAQIMDLSSKWFDNYTWNIDSFHLKLFYPQSTIPPNTNIESNSDIDRESCADCYHLYGCVKFGDYINDEWFIVRLLFQISRHFHDLTISTIDSDGQFLLIEAAELLPNWINPRTSTNRIFIRKGQLHIIPRPTTFPEKAIIPQTIKKPSLGINIVRLNMVETLASTPIRDIISKRINKEVDNNISMDTVELTMKNLFTELNNLEKKERLNNKNNNKTSEYGSDFDEEVDKGIIIDSSEEDESEDEIVNAINKDTNEDSFFKEYYRHMNIELTDTNVFAKYMEEQDKLEK